MLDNILYLLSMTVERTIDQNTHGSANQKQFAKETSVKAICDSLKKSLPRSNQQIISILFSEGTDLSSNIIAINMRNEIRTALSLRFDIPPTAVEEISVLIAKAVINAFTSNFDKADDRNIALERFIEVFAGGRKVSRNRNSTVSINNILQA